MASRKQPAAPAPNLRDRLGVKGRAFALNPSASEEQERTVPIPRRGRHKRIRPIILLLSAATVIFLVVNAGWQMHQLGRFSRLRFHTLHGDSLTLARYRGDFVLMLLFRPGVAEDIEQIREMQEGLAGLSERDVHLFVVPVVPVSERTLQVFLMQNQIRFPLLVPEQKALEFLQQAERLPAIYITDRKLRLQIRHFDRIPLELVWMEIDALERLHQG